VESLHEWRTTAIGGKESNASTMECRQPHEKEWVEPSILEKGGNCCANSIHARKENIQGTYLDIVLGAASIISGGIIAAWGYLDLLLDTGQDPGQRGLKRWIRNPDVFVGALAFWGLTTLGLCKLGQNDKYTNRAIVAGTMTGIAVDVCLSVITQRWTSFGCSLMISISITLALGRVRAEMSPALRVVIL